MLGALIPRRRFLKSGVTLLLGTPFLSTASVVAKTPKQRKLFFSMLAHETNSFSPMTTDIGTFKRTMVPAGRLSNASVSPLFAALRMARQQSASKNWKPVQGTLTYGAPGAAASREVYEEIRDQILSDLEEQMPVDIVALMLHGAMTAEGYDSCELDLLRRIRQLVGDDVVIGAVLDSHAHLLEETVNIADVLIATKEYPHIDFAERSEELIELLDAASCNRVQPVSSLFDCRMIDSYHTTREPMRSFVDKISALEESDDDILSISVIHSFPWSDTPAMGTKILVITDGEHTRAKGRELAYSLGHELFALRGQLSQRWTTLASAMEQIESESDGLIVVADAADNPGGGAACDATYILEALLEKQIDHAVFGRLYDTVSLKKAIAIGEGSSAVFSLGGKLSAFSGNPIRVYATVKKILRENEKGVNGQAGFGFNAVWLAFEGIDIVVSDLREQTISTNEFERFGIDLKSKKVVVVKSSQHFLTSFGPIARKVIYVDTPALLTQEIKSLPYKRIQRPKWPFDKDPFGEIKSKNTSVSS